MLEPSVLVILVELGSSAVEELRQLVIHDAGISCADDGSIPMKIHLGSACIVVAKLKLILVTPVLEHVLVVLHVPWLEVFLQSLHRIRGYRAIGWRLLRFCEGPFCYRIIYSRSFFKNLAVEDVLSLIGLV